MGRERLAGKSWIWTSKSRRPPCSCLVSGRQASSKACRMLNLPRNQMMKKPTVLQSEPAAMDISYRSHPSLVQPHTHTPTSCIGPKTKIISPRSEDGLFSCRSRCSLLSDVDRRISLLSDLDRWSQHVATLSSLPTILSAHLQSYPVSRHHQHTGAAAVRPRYREPAYHPLLPHVVFIAFWG